MQVSKYWFNFIRTLLPMVSNPLGNPKTLSSPSIDTTSSSILVRDGISDRSSSGNFLRQMPSFSFIVSFVPFFLQFFHGADGEWHGIYCIYYISPRFFFSFHLTLHRWIFRKKHHCYPSPWRLSSQVLFHWILVFVVLFLFHFHTLYQWHHDKITSHERRGY